MDVKLYIGGVERTDLVVRTVRASYVRPWEATILWPGRHDEPPDGVRLWDEVRIEDTGSNVLFRGNITAIRPGGVAREGLIYTASGRRFRLENEPVRINGSGFYVWNRRGFQGDDGAGAEDSPGKDGGRWTAGEIIIDILEHALGIPAGGSDIPGHHGAACCVSHTYLDSSDIAGYTAADILALDSVVGEFSVNGNTTVADAISLLLGLNGGFYGWYIDPSTGRLEVVDLDSLATSDLEAGMLGTWQDAAGTDYVLLDNELEWSLEGVASAIVIQGSDRTLEEQPANIEGTGNPGKGNRGELELVAAPWNDVYAAAYRPVCQTGRTITGRQIDPDDDYTPPAGSTSATHAPRIYRGTDAGAKWAYGHSATILYDAGLILFPEAPVLDPGEKLWLWYHAATPFTVQAGPEGDAYDCYGYERTRVYHDPSFRHSTGWPHPGTEDDATAMYELAGRLLRLFRDVRRQGVLRCDRVDFDSFNLARRYNVVNLGPTTTSAAGTTTTSGCIDPTCWSRLAINAVDVLYDFEHDATEITVANTFWMLEDYSELKRRLELNLFAGRNLVLSQDIYDTMVRNFSVVHDIEITGPTTTAAPGTTTTTTTTSPAGAPACPDGAWCRDDCPASVYADWPDSCSPGGSGQIRWDHVGAPTCVWDVAANEIDAGVSAITCEAGEWKFLVNVSPTWSCSYAKTAGPISCPTGTYSLQAGGSACCPSEITVYS